MRLRAFLVASLLALPITSLSLKSGPSFQGVNEAHASVSILLSLEELLASSSAVVVATATERKSQWEDLAGGKRIVTYTKLKIDQTITGTSNKEVWVRTLGGVVDKLGQAVSGEAQLTLNSKSVLFLMKRGDVTMVTAMAQGHFPIVNDEKGVARLRGSPDAGTQLRTPGPTVAARDLLLGQTLDGASKAILKARKAIDEKKK